MPPRIPSRVFASVPFSNGAVASSSTSPPPPARSPSIDNRRNFSSHSHSGRLRPKSPEVFRAASTHPEVRRYPDICSDAELIALIAETFLPFIFSSKSICQGSLRSLGRKEGGKRFGYQEGVLSGTRTMIVLPKCLPNAPYSWRRNGIPIPTKTRGPMRSLWKSRRHTM